MLCDVGLLLLVEYKLEKIRTVFKPKPKILKVCMLVVKQFTHIHSNDCLTIAAIIKSTNTYSFTLTGEA